MRKANNQEHLEGRVYQHTLEVKVVNNPTSPNNGKEFIAGRMQHYCSKECKIIGIKQKMKASYK